jgi:hypothetical protein
VASVRLRIVEGYVFYPSTKVFQTNLLTLGLDGIDVILGMDWMTHHKITLDIAERSIEINSPAVGASTLFLPFRESLDPIVPKSQ